MANKNGKLIVFEGIDGSGKTTQARLLFDFFRKKKINTEYISFPRYSESLWGKMIRDFLDGKFGKNVDPYFSSMLYAGDRFSASFKLEDWFSAGKMVVCNRYVGSNICHMGAKIESQKERAKFIDWLEKLEYGENKIPREDLVFFLSVPVFISKKLMKGRKLDIHESDLKYLEKCRKTYEDLLKSKKNWVKIETTREGKLLKPLEIHLQILEILREKRFI